MVQSPWSNNRVDEYSDSIDAIKITAYGRYIADVLAHNFSYLDLICLDCGIHNEGVSNTLALLGNADRDLFLASHKRERITARIKRVRTFLDYLTKEEAIEREVYNLDTTDRIIMESLRSMYDMDERRVLKSANRNYGADSSPEALGLEIADVDTDAGEEETFLPA
jgi:hypothetical protein